MWSLKRPILAGLALCASAAALAAPMGFKGSYMGMTDLGENWREGWINYALTPRDAVGAGGLFMRSDDKTQSRKFTEATYTRLLKRFNAEHSQANIWLLTGAGGVTGNDFTGTRTMLAPGVSADFETTRVYASVLLRLYRAPGINHDYAAVRAGFSFYESDYDELQPWFVVEARRMRGLSESIEITPMLRLIHNRYFVEAGVNQAKQVRFNLMVIF